nr:hypothetical protein CFP56_53651 [Quercus suber]
MVDGTASCFGTALDDVHVISVCLPELRFRVKSAGFGAMAMTTVLTSRIMSYAGTSVQCKESLVARTLDVRRRIPALSHHHVHPSIYASIPRHRLRCD